MNEVKKADRGHLRLLECVLSRTYDSVIILETNRFDRSDLLIAEVNQSFFHLTGFRPKEAIGQSFVRLLGLDSDSNFLSQFNHNILKQNPFKIKMRSYLENGTRKCLDHCFIPISQYSDQSARWVAIQRDWAEIIPSDKLSFLKTHIVDQAQQALFITTLEGLINRWNFEASKLFQYPDVEILGKDISILYKNQSRSYFLNLVTNLLKNGRSLYIRQTMKRKNGDTFDAVLCHSPLRDQEGNIVGITHNLNISSPD